MSQKAPKEQIPALLAELTNRTANVKHMKVLDEFISLVTVPGCDVVEVGMAVNWLKNVIAGEDARCAELKAMLPDQDTEIKLGEAPKADPEPPPAPAVDGKLSVSVGGVEMSKGSEVLQTA